MPNRLTRLSVAKYLALVGGSLCLIVSLTLVLVSILSSRYILLEQEADYGHAVAQEFAVEIGEVLGRGDRISLEVALEQLIAVNQLHGIAVYDVEQRQIGAAGIPSGQTYSSPVNVAGKIAGELQIYLADNDALLEQRSMALSLVMLALLLSLFVSALSYRLANNPANRLRQLIEKLQLDSQPTESGSELEILEKTVAKLPLELLKPKHSVKAELADYETTGLLYIHLRSLLSYVETLDENALLRYTDFQHRLISSAAELYQGELQVVRQFGVLLSFGGEHQSGSPVFRAACCSWIIKHLAQSLRKRANLKLDMTYCIGVSEAGAITRGGFYSALYCQHIIDDMESLLPLTAGDIQCTDDAAADAGIINTVNLKSSETGQHTLEGFPAPTDNLVERQHQLLLSRIGRGI